MNLKEYFNNTHVRARMTEYLGGPSPGEASCVYLTSCTDLSRMEEEMRPPSELDYFLQDNVEITRSLWDHAYLLVHLDIDYVNFDFPAEPYLNPLRTFALQQPVERSLERMLIHFDIAPLHILTPRGHHFVWQIRQDSAAFDKLADIGHLSRHMKNYYAGSVKAPFGETISPKLGSAFAGLGLVMEYLALRVQADSFGDCPVPLEITEVHTGPQERGREIIAIDISEYGDPLNTRIIRIPFSTYLKPWFREGILNRKIENEIPVMYPVPLHEMDTSKGIIVMRDAAEAAKLAGRTSVRIPDFSEAMESLVSTYIDSGLAEFHKFFYRQEHEPSEKWPETYDQTPLSMLPPCLQEILRQPNDLLQKPAGIRQIVRGLLSLGWHPRHIAGLIRSKYERDYGWGREWYHYDAGMRADFYTRLFSAQIVLEQDDLLDFNCLSTKEKGLCFHPDHSCNLRPLKDSLLKRRKENQLGHRPFNKLYPEEKYL